MKRIALFLPFSSPFYNYLFQSIQRGFETNGVEVVGCVGLLPENELAEFCRQTRPDAVLEMNRTRHQLPSLPNNVFHISWIVDTCGRSGYEFSGSEILYFFGSNWHRNHHGNGSALVDWLPPAVCPETFYYGKRIKESDFSFIGHISFPWSDEEKGRVLHADGDRSLTFGEFFEFFQEAIRDVDPGRMAHDGYLQLALSVLKTNLGMVPQLDQVVLYDLGCRTIRMFNRTGLLKQMLTDPARSVRLYGTGGWASWPLYRKYFHGPLNNPDQLRTVYQNSAINFHEGVGVHFRSLECMASGGFLFHYQPSNRKEPGGLQTLFTPDIHFVSITASDLQEKADFYLTHPDEADRISRAASEEVLRNHTWAHRARKIIGDFKKAR